MQSALSIAKHKILDPKQGKWFDRVKDYFEATFGSGWLAK